MAVAVEPAYVDAQDGPTGMHFRFFRTDVSSAAEVVNGKAWIQSFEHVLQKLPELPRPGPRQRRALGVSMSEGHDPRHTMQSFGMKQRNDALKAMRDAEQTPGLPDPARHGFGKVLTLPSGHEVLLVCNVGPAAAAALPQRFRDTPLEQLTWLAVAARCPHAGSCLNDGELKDVEDLATPGRRALIRCPQHNMQFDLHTGQGEGNYLQLQRFPVQVAHGAVYIGVPLPGTQAAEGTPAPQPAAEAAMDVDMTDGGAELEALPQPPRGPDAVVPASALAGSMPPPAVPVCSSSAALERCRSRTPRSLRKTQTLI